jgi:hypothetical protein
MILSILTSLQLIRPLHSVDASFYFSAAAFLTLLQQEFKLARILTGHFRVLLPPGPQLDELTLFPSPAIKLLGIFYLQYRINRFLKVRPSARVATGTMSLPNQLQELL